MGCTCCVQFVNLHSLQNVLCDLAWLGLGTGSALGVSVKVRFRAEICKVRMCDFKTVQIDELCATHVRNSRTGMDITQHFLLRRQTVRPKCTYGKVLSRDSNCMLLAVHHKAWIRSNVCLWLQDFGLWKNTKQENMQGTTRNDEALILWPVCYKLTCTKWWYHYVVLFYWPICHSDHGSGWVV